MATSSSSSSSATASGGVSSSSSPEVRTVEQLKKKERRKSLRERLVASWGLHAADGGAADPAQPRHSAGLHKVQGGRVVGLAHDYEVACGGGGTTTSGVTGNSSTNDDHYHNNNGGTPRRRFDGSSSAGSPRPGLRYKNGRTGATEMYRSSPILGSPPLSARRDVDAFRSEGNLSSYVQAATVAQPAETTSTTTTTATSAADGGDGGSELKKGSGWWRPKKMFGKSLKKTKKKRKDDDDDSDQDEEEDEAKEESEVEQQVSIHVLIKRSDVEGIARLISASRKPKRGGGTGGVDDIVNRKSALGSTPLHTAVEVGDLEVVQLLLRSGANPDLVDGIGWTPLLAACKAGNLPMAQALLVDGKADANSKTNDLNTPLHYLAGKAPKDDTRELYYDVMTRLLGKEGKVYGMVANNTTSRNKNGDTPLHYAAMHGRPEVVQWLLDHHAAVNNQNTYGDTALHCAVIRGDVEMVQLLLKSGASKSLAGRSGTPKEVAKSEHADNASLLALF